MSFSTTFHLPVLNLPIHVEGDSIYARRVVGAAIMALSATATLLVFSILHRVGKKLDHDLNSPLVRFIGVVVGLAKMTIPLVLLAICIDGLAFATFERTLLLL